MATDSDEYVKVAPLSELREEGRRLVGANGRAIAVFYHEGEVHAVDNRCPHMGFPLEEGSVDDGVLTCHWHHARFELSCGDTFDPWADDVQSFPVEVRDGSGRESDDSGRQSDGSSNLAESDGEVWVRTTPTEDRSPVERWTERLETGLEENLRLVVAKSTIGLDDAGVPAAEPLTVGAHFGAQYREDGWGPGLTIHAAMANVLDDLRLEDRRRALYTGLTSVADDCAGQPPWFPQDGFDTDEVSAERLTEWFRECVEVRDRDGAERTLRTAIRTQSPETVANVLFAAATDHRYLDAGHTLDFVNKAFELLERIGWEHADEVLPSVVPRLTDATRSEELSAWRQPDDLAGLLATAFEDLDELVDAGEGEEWTPPEGFTETLLGEDPEAIVDALSTAVREGASVEALAAEVAHAAARRVAQFSTANEFNDWNTVHHTFTYANAVHQAAGRTSTPTLYRGVFDAATSVYLDRFLNTPPARLPDPDGSGEPAALREELLDAFDEEGEVNRAGELAAEYLVSGGDPAGLKETLGRGLLREDAGFHTLQSLEAGFRQFDATDDPERARLALVAVARYMAAHFPTRREQEQTFTIAERLNRGERLHEE